MSLEDDVYNSLDGTGLTSLYLTGGLYKAGDLGETGITRVSAPAAFDSDGYLKPCALIRQRSEVPTGELSDYDYKLMSERKVVEIYLYQDGDTGYDKIDGAVSFIKLLLTGEIYANSFELNLDNVLQRQRDNGALKGASLNKMDWSVVSISWDPPLT